MINKLSKIICYAVFFTLGHGLFEAIPAQETQQEYTIGTGDRVAVKFWQKPEYNTDARVSASGEIQLPLIGAIQADGLTLKQLRDNIENRISLVDVNITQASVTVLEYGSKTVYITGAVGGPGKKNFEVIPNLWKIILEAGGPLPTAQLDDVTIVRGSGVEAGKILHVNLTEALEKGDLSSLPVIYPGDTIHILQLPATPGSQNLSPSPLAQRDLILVFGQVNNPGRYNIEKRMNLLDAIVLAGGFTENANMSSVRILFRGREHEELAIVDIKKYLDRSAPLPLMLNSGDAIFVPAKATFSPWMAEVFRTLIYITASFLVFRLSN